MMFQGLRIMLRSCDLEFEQTKYSGTVRWTCRGHLLKSGSIWKTCVVMPGASLCFYKVWFRRFHWNLQSFLPTFVSIFILNEADMACRVFVAQLATQGQLLLVGAKVSLHKKPSDLYWKICVEMKPLQIGGFVVVFFVSWELTNIFVWWMDAGEQLDR